MLHISRCVSARQTQWAQPHCSISILSKVRGRKNAFDLSWPRMTQRRGHWVKSTYGSSRVAWDKTILRYLAWYLSYFWNKKHLIIFPLPYNGLVRKLTRPQVTEIKIPRYTNCTYWCPYQLLEVACLPIPLAPSRRNGKYFWRLDHLTWPGDLT